MYIDKLKRIGEITLIFLIAQTAILFAAPNGEIAPNGITLSFYQNAMITNIGGEAGVERYWLCTEKRKVIGSVSFLFLQNPDVVTTAGIIIGNSLRRTFRPGIYLEQGIRGGYLGSYYHIDTYKTDRDNNIINVKQKLESTVMGGYTVGIGYDFAKLTKLDAQLFVKPLFYLRYPNFSNVYIMHNFSLEMGVAIHPGWMQPRK